MNIVVIGGSGLIGSKLVGLLRAGGHQAIPASPASRVNTVTGEGLDQALAGAQVVVDVSNSPSFEDQAVLDFFVASGRNIGAAEARAGVRHHVALSVVGTDRLPDNGYFRAKLAQETLIRESPVPYTIVRSTQFFEFLGGIANVATDGSEDSPDFDGLHLWIADNLGLNLTVDLLAEQALMSPRHFARVYKQKIGRTPAKTVELFRLEAARRMLEDSERNVDQIARLCGFADEERMRATFQRHLAISPRDYRQRFAG